MQKKIVLVGYMGTGKTSIGKKLADKLAIPFIDLDHYIENQEGIPINQLFKTKGALYFRKQEKIYLEKLLNDNKSFVLATGGGTPCYYNNMKKIIEHAVSVFINTPLNELVSRLQKEKAKRPLISHLTDVDLTEFVAKHLFERNQFYQQAKINYNNNTTIDTIVNDLAKQIATTH